MRGSHEDPGHFRPCGPAAQVLPAPDLVVRGHVLHVQAAKPQPVVGSAFQRPNVTKDVSAQPLQQPDLPLAQAPQPLQVGGHPPAGRHPGLLQRQGTRGASEINFRCPLSFPPPPSLPPLASLPIKNMSEETCFIKQCQMVEMASSFT